MTALFISCVCDYCDGLVPIDWLRGYIVFRGDEDFDRPVYVFPTQTDAALYRSRNDWQQYPLRAVHYELPVPWKVGSSKMEGVTIAARPFTLHRDHRFELQPYHCFLAPKRAIDRAA